MKYYITKDCGKGPVLSQITSGIAWFPTIKDGPTAINTKEEAEAIITKTCKAQPNFTLTIIDEQEAELFLLAWAIYASRFGKHYLETCEARNPVREPPPPSSPYSKVDMSKGLNVQVGAPIDDPWIDSVKEPSSPIITEDPWSIALDDEVPF